MFILGSGEGFCSLEKVPVRMVYVWWLDPSLLASLTIGKKKKTLKQTKHHNIDLNDCGWGSNRKKSAHVGLEATVRCRWDAARCCASRWECVLSTTPKPKV